MEHCFRHDFSMAARRKWKQNKYIGLTKALEAEGWTVEGDKNAGKKWEDTTLWAKYGEFPEEGELAPPLPVHTFVQGHMGSFCKQDIQSLLAMGVDLSDVQRLLRKLYYIAANRLHSCVASYQRACILAKKPAAAAASATAHASPAPAGVPPPSASAPAGVG
jgi:hypothetical protein